MVAKDFQARQRNVAGSPNVRFSTSTSTTRLSSEEEDLDLLRRGAAVLGYMASSSQRCQREMAKRRGVYSAVARVQKLIVKAAGDNAAAPEYMQQLMEKLCPGLSKLILNRF